jgi:Thymidylate kinase
MDTQDASAHRPARGRFITVEGVDGAGKSSHIEAIAAQIRAAGHELVVTREPGGTPLGETLRQLLLTEAMDIGTEVLLMFAARREHIVQVIEPALAAGRWVLSDRFTSRMPPSPIRAPGAGWASSAWQYWSAGCRPGATSRAIPRRRCCNPISHWCSMCRWRWRGSDCYVTRSSSIVSRLSSVRFISGCVTNTCAV